MEITDQLTCTCYSDSGGHLEHTVWVNCYERIVDKESINRLVFQIVCETGYDPYSYGMWSVKVKRIDDYKYMVDWRSGWGELKPSVESETDPGGMF
ncbi:hypothetical protein [Mechercharimyces sp. CAU 1602]|uniref:hypothetical protein n=1 Tax=Mechercharimyces sp. CAU 1602 TaxID=2973933 RepID=UPI002161565A|nr:hypothetical protein [Mechercharimyces sp. CAU 1602]MCS1351184.1 hypothetical protein [Mechercharimyces sp. CAU 1602]